MAPCQQVSKFGNGTIFALWFWRILIFRNVFENNSLIPGNSSSLDDTSSSALDDGECTSSRSRPRLFCRCSTCRRCSGVNVSSFVAGEPSAALPPAEPSAALSGRCLRPAPPHALPSQAASVCPLRPWLLWFVKPLSHASLASFARLHLFDLFDFARLRMLCVL